MTLLQSPDRFIEATHEEDVREGGNHSKMNGDDEPEDVKEEESPIPRDVQKYICCVACPLLREGMMHIISSQGNTDDLVYLIKTHLESNKYGFQFKSLTRATLANPLVEVVEMITESNMDTDTRAITNTWLDFLFGKDDGTSLPMHYHHHHVFQHKVVMHEMMRQLPLPPPPPPPPPPGGYDSDLSEGETFSDIEDNEETNEAARKLQSHVRAKRGYKSEAKRSTEEELFGNLRNNVVDMSSAIEELNDDEQRVSSVSFSKEAAESGESLQQQHKHYRKTGVFKPGELSQGVDDFEEERDEQRVSSVSFSKEAAESGESLQQQHKHYRKTGVFKPGELSQGVDDFEDDPDDFHDAQETHSKHSPPKISQSSREKEFFENQKREKAEKERIEQERRSKMPKEEREKLEKGEADKKAHDIRQTAHLTRLGKAATGAGIGRGGRGRVGRGGRGGRGRGQNRAEKGPGTQQATELETMPTPILPPQSPRPRRNTTKFAEGHGDDID